MLGWVGLGIEREREIKSHQINSGGGGEEKIEEKWKVEVLLEEVEVGR